MESALLSGLCDVWLRQIKKAGEHKKRVFGDTAERIWMYYGKQHDKLPSDVSLDGFEEYLSGGGINDFWRATVGKTSEYVRLMLPYLHHRVPHRLAAPDRPTAPEALLGGPFAMDPNTGQPIIDPMSGQPLPNPMLMAYQQSRQQDEHRAFLMGWWLNYLAHANDLRQHARPAVIESLVKGAGVVWHEVAEGSYGDVPFTSYDTEANLLIDPDCQMLHEADWIARRRRRPAWKVAEEFGLDTEKLRGQHASYRQQAEDEFYIARVGGNDGGKPDELRGDILEYWEIYSRVGLGQKFHGIAEEIKEARAVLDTAGPYVYLAVARGIPHPLNLPPELLAVEGQAELKQRISWPLPTHELRTEPWPMTMLGYYPGTDTPWPTAPLESCLKLQIFLDYAYGYLMRTIKTRTRDMWIASDSIQFEIVQGLIQGMDQEIIQVKGRPGVDLKELLTVLQHPDIKPDLFNIIQGISGLYEELSGMSELMSGKAPARAMRSAQEAALVGNAMSIRPDDMAEMVEDWHSRIAQKEGFLSRIGVVSPATVAALTGEPDPTAMVEDPVMGPTQQMPGPLTQAWMALVQTDDPRKAASEMEYTVEAGSGRKRNKAKQLEDVNQAIPTLAPMFIPYFQATGNPTQVNGLIRMWAEAMDVDPTPLYFPNMPPAPPQQEQGPPQGQPAAPPQQQG